MSARLTGSRSGGPQPTALVRVPAPAGAPALPTGEIEAAAGYARAEKAPATRRAYGTDFAIFRAWCAERGADPLRAAALRVTIRRSKTDQEGLGAVVALPRGAVACPVAAFKAWIRAAGITAGPVFRPIAKGERLWNARLTDRSVAKIVKAHAVRVGLDPAAFAGHSLRSGFLTSAAARGGSIFKMAADGATFATPRSSRITLVWACCERRGLLVSRRMIDEVDHIDGLVVVWAGPKQSGSFRNKPIRLRASMTPGQ